MRIPRSTWSTDAPAAVLLGAALVLGVTGCGGDDESAAPTPSATEHNEADVAFASDMMQHHAQALVMADMTMKRSLDPEVEQLVEQIRAAQVPEIEQFDDWLVDWDEEVPETVRDHANAGHGMDGIHDMDGMEALEEASGEEFQRMWLEMMIEHHEGAIELAETEQREGRFQPALDLAADIASSQEREIGQMQRLLEP